MDVGEVKAGRLNSNVEIGKYTVLTRTNANYADGVDVPSAANAGALAGVAQESVLPDGVNDYSGGVYQIASGTAWPSNSIPSVGTGRGIAYAISGITRVIAGTGTIAVGDRLNVADSQGRVKTVSESSGVLVHEIGIALDPSTVAGTVIRMQITNVDRKA